MEEVVNAVYDIPDERDYQYEILMGDINFEKIEFPNINIFNQGLSPITKMACTRAGLGHVINGQNKVNGLQELDILGFWKRYLAINPLAEQDGASLQSALDQALKESLISGYFKIISDEGRKDALNKGFWIYTGSNNGDWSSVKYNKIYKLRDDQELLGHAFMFPEYKKLLNSYGNLNGYADFPEELYNTTYTQYAIMPKKAYDINLIYKNKIMSNIKLEGAKKAFENNFWNGLDGDKPITREETSAMIERVYEKLIKELK